MAAKPKTIDDYLATVSDEKRAALEKLRKAIHAAAPGAEECISYQIPFFRLDGKFLVGNREGPACGRHAPPENPFSFSAALFRP